MGEWTVGPYRGNGYSAVVVEAEKEDQNAALKIIDPEMIERSGIENQLRRVLREKELAGHGHEPLRLCRRPFCLSYAAIAVSFSMAK